MNQKISVKDFHFFCSKVLPKGFYERVFLRKNNSKKKLLKLIKKNLGKDKNYLSTDYIR